MSKTFRRKNINTKTQIEYDNLEIVYWMHYRFGRELDFSECTDEYVTKEWHRYHGDKDFGYSPPKDFTKEYNRRFRNRAKQTLNRSIRDMNEDEVVFDPFIKDARWNYW